MMRLFERLPEDPVQRFLVVMPILWLLLCWIPACLILAWKAH